MAEPGIVNVINFIRGVEPRDPSCDLLEPVVNQVRLIRRYRLPATFLLQYDALLDDRFVSLLKDNLDRHCEVGGWFEVVQPQVERAGLTWRGRYPWDWHSDVGFSIGYPPAEREKLADVFMAEFRRVFGCYPRSVGSWFMDAHLLGYLADRYHVLASCNCKDQWGTDGYSLWGGYFNQAYYPSRRNAYMPAQHASEQIPIPIFRMLGSDPIYQYDAGLFDENGEGKKGQGVVTLEPAYKDGGGAPEWVRWFFDVNFNAPCLSFAYAQVGQENAFGWPAMARGLTHQIQLLAEKVAAGCLQVQTLEDSARWFRSKYDLTGASAVVALKDWRNEGRRSVWYCSRFYRVNFFWEGERFWLRDVHLFDETYAERYLTAVCTTPNCLYDTLPVLDGYHWSRGGIRAGLRIVEISPDQTHREILSGKPEVSGSGDTLIITWQGDGRAVRIECRPGALTFDVSSSPGEVWALEMTWAPNVEVPLTRIDPRAIHYRHNHHNYQIHCPVGSISRGEGDRSILIRPEGSRAVLAFGGESK